jgi:hypothetical protein
LELITRRRRRILVHSFLYYRLNESIIEDYIFDLWSKELAELQKQYPEESAKSIYAKDFKDFDGSSGYYLPYSHPEIQNVGYRLLRISKKI